MKFAQVPERFYYQSNMVAIDETPLESYFEKSGIRPSFVVPYTGLFRGYIGSWQVENNQLYLIGIEAMLDTGQVVDLEMLFPKHKEKVFAAWYTGTIRLPYGQLENAIHLGYTSVYEKDIILVFQDGMLVSQKLQQNYALS